MNEYAKRRAALLKKIEANSLVIIPAAPEIIRNGDAHYPFRQSSNFYYLTGLVEPEAVLILAPQRAEGEFILFNQVRDRSREIWDGPRIGQEGAIKSYGADQAFPISELASILPDLMQNREILYCPIGTSRHFDKTLMRAIQTIRSQVRAGVGAPSVFCEVGKLLDEMRLIKSPAEIAVLQKAIDITAKAHVRAMQVCKPGMYEYELEAELLYAFMQGGARSPAYTSIVGSGVNTCILHYIANNKQIMTGDLVLIDAGAEYENYAADITRTFPAEGKFSAEQKAIYEIVLAAQLAAIDSIKPGVSWTKPQEIIVNVMTQGLLDLGLLQGNLQELIETEAYFQFYMHRSGHWLGLDVHDVGQYRISNRWRELQPDMVFTVEPGLYISADLNVDPRWHNIGVRIEDDVLVSAHGCEVLSSTIPKTIFEIEMIMAK